MYDVRLSEKAEDDLFEIATYISEQLQNPTAAVSTIAKIERALQKRLSTFPYSYPIHSYLESFGIEYRRTIINNFSAFYIADETDMTVTITHVFYNKRDFGKVFK